VDKNQRLGLASYYQQQMLLVIEQEKGIISGFDQVAPHMMFITSGWIKID
jgi:hypothetical protein